MSIASFASKIFNVSSNKIYTFDSFSRSSSLNIEEQEVEGQKPSSYIKGSNLEDISFSIPLILQQNLDIESEIRDWIRIKDDAIPYLLIINSKPVGSNKYLLVNVSETESKFDAKGKYLKSNLQLQFKEFVRYGAKKKDASTSSGSKSSKKRDNPNATLSKAQGIQMDQLEKELYGG